MGERVLFQVVKGEDFSPVVYCHWSGEEVRRICDRLRRRMEDRYSDLEYTAARLVQECIDGDQGNLRFGIWNTDFVLNGDYSQGDGGVVIVDVSGPQMEFKCFGGYWETVPGDLPRLKTASEQRTEHFYEALSSP